MRLYIYIYICMYGYLDGNAVCCGVCCGAGSKFSAITKRAPTKTLTTRGPKLLKNLLKISNLPEFMQDFIPDFNCIIFQLLWEMAFLYEYRIINAAEILMQTLKPIILARNQTQLSFEASRLPCIVTQNHPSHGIIGTR